MPTLADLTNSYLAGAAKLRAAVAGMTPEQAKARPIAGKWSTLEVVAHIADFETVLADRMQRVLALNKPLLFSADENDFAKNLAYDHRNLAEELAFIEAMRTKMARMLRALPEEVMQRKGNHTEKGLITFEQLLTGAVGHIEHHLPFIAAKRTALSV